MFSAQGINLTTLIKRLEAATSRLEDLAVAHTTDFREVQAAQRSSATPSLPVSKEATPQFNTSVFSPETPSSVTSETIVEEEKRSPVIADYEKLIKDQVEPWISKSEKIGSVVSEQATAVGHLFQMQLGFLQIVQKAQEPSSPQVLLELLGPTQLALDAVTSIRERNRASKLFNHLATVREGIAAVGWVTMEGAEAPKYVGEMRDASQFYGNRVVREYKDSGDILIHKEWQTSFTEILNELQKFVRKNFPQGIKWNAAGAPADQFIGISSHSPVTSPSSSLTATTNNPPPPARTPSPGTGGPPPPPPPPPSAESLLASIRAPTSGSSSTNSMGAVFSQINQGEGITSGLKHIDKSQMTHKNPALREKRASPNLPPKPAALQRSPSGGSATAKVNKPAGKKVLEGNKWIIENFDGEKTPIKIDESQTDINHSVLIYGVKNSTIQIGGKINTVSMNNCEGTGLVLDTLVAGVEISKSKKIQLQILNKAPMVNVDHVDQLTIYLSKTCLDAEIITTCVVGMNVQVPNEKEDGDYFERPVPESMRHVIAGGKLVSSVLEHSG